MPSRLAPENRFLSQPITRLFWANALPMILIMMMSGLLSLVDALFLGRFVGTGALTAVSVVFPVTMLTIAFATLVSGGMSSLLARDLGAAEARAAGAVFARAHGLALLLALGLIAAFALAGGWVTARLAGGDPAIAGMAWTYLAITLGGTPVQFWLGLHGDAMRNEGRAGLMALLSVGVTLANIALNYLLIVELEGGVAGSAWGTIGAQALGLAALVAVRLRGALLPLAALRRFPWWGGWGGILTLGAPMSLGFTGIALVSALVISTLRATSGADYPALVAAYGIVTRLLGFTFLPIMALGLATQSIAGNNAGAGRMDRAGAALRLALAASALYCGAVAALMIGGGAVPGGLFVTDPAVTGRVAGILRPTMALYIVQGPVLVLAMYFQALGLAGRTALLTLARPYLLMPVLIPGLGLTLGAGAIWYAFPLADLCLGTLALMLWWRARVEAPA
ncbi:MATE family efflux transporter [Pararhodobacter aggregans]|uniref:MATE family efflux transporter n=1 Tax=Pararhodobacter aggregans TaxID=404875 RepID=A0A2T7URQ3_9RHOB|nr:MATE family efflux transporter [Pararhodobacter aggregans]PTX00347.1 Na+-driven multidrug efflux pump [Pararhodobacter aggregans]PVE47332.1 MATE family efflux transporter [Pararhodobacter aggregans]